jgi:hypothetical protein
MFPPDDKRFDYLSRLSVVSTGEQFTLDNNAALDFWHQTGSLQLLAGLCMLSQSGEMMRSQIFFGDLKGNLRSESFQADLPVNPDEFSRTRDLHTASMLYALAEEAITRRLAQDLIIDYLSEARLIASQVDSTAGRELKDAIEASLKEIKAPPPMGLSR